MNSFFKGICHTILSLLSLYLPTLLTGNPYISAPLQGVLIVGLNWLLSQTVATTTGASARQA